MDDAHWRAHGEHGDVLHERSARLEPALTSAATARRLVREALEAAGRSAWVDAGELAISELVTNAALHAHTEIDLRLEVFDNRLCVEVRDFNPILPVQRNYDDHATTGPGEERREVECAEAFAEPDHGPPSEGLRDTWRRTEFMGNDDNDDTEKQHSRP